MVKCNACGGTYEPLQADGTQYFHACPPLSDAEVAKAIGLPADLKEWTPEHQAAVDGVPRVRKNARDENLPGTSAKDTGKLKSAGAGVTKVS